MDRTISISARFTLRNPASIVRVELSNTFPAGCEVHMVWALLIAVVLIIVILIGMYNGLVRLKVQTDNAWADIDVQLKRRYDLIPNLVETVKGYAGHEKETLERVIQARNQAFNAQGPAQAAAAENVLQGALKSLFAVTEAYPQLRAVESFTALQA